MWHHSRLAVTSQHIMQHDAMVLLLAAISCHERSRQINLLLSAQAQPS